MFDLRKELMAKVVKKYEEDKAKTSMSYAERILECAITNIPETILIEEIEEKGIGIAVEWDHVSMWIRETKSNTILYREKGLNPEGVKSEIDVLRAYFEAHVNVIASYEYGFSTILKP